MALFPGDLPACFAVDRVITFLNHQIEIARDIVRKHFSTPSSLGMLRLREHRLFRSDFNVDEFIQVLAEVFLP